MSASGAKFRLAFAAIVLVCAGCDSNDTRDPSPIQPPETPAAKAEAAGWGPLAVVDFPGGGGSLASAGTGTVKISDDCVIMVLSSGAKVLPVWQAGDVAWLREHAAIRFAGLGDELTIRHGDQVTLGGQALRDDDPKVRTDVPWEHQPQPSCRGVPFLVHQVTMIPTE